MDSEIQKEYLEHYPNKLKSFDVLVNTYKIELQGNAPKPLIVKIWKTSNGIYYHSMSYWITSKNKGADVYKSIENCSSEKDAIHDAVVHSLMFYDPDSKYEDNMIEENKFYKNEL